MRQILFLLFSLLTLSISAQVGVKMSLDTAAILIGEQVQLKTQVSIPAGKKVKYPPIEERGLITPGVEVVAVGKIDTSVVNDGQRWELTRNYTITSFDSALYFIPPFTVEVDGKAYATQSKVGLKVSSVPVDTTHVEKFDGLRPPVEADFSLNWWLVVAFFLLALSVVGIVFVVRRLRQKGVETKRVILVRKLPAHQTALEKIEAFKQQNPETVEAQQHYYDELTAVLRNYIEERFGIRTHEMTSSDIITAVTHSHDATALRELQEILATADLVKFAKQPASVGEKDRNLMQAIDYIQLTKPSSDAPIEETTIVEVPNKTIVRHRRFYQCALGLFILVSVVLLVYLLKEAYEIFL